MQFYEYKGFTIYPMPRLLFDSDTWSVSLTIRRREKVKAFSAPNSFTTKGEAVFQCITFGKKIIDDEIFGYTIHDLL
ncbi:CV_2116 domain-containing protein [Geobacter sp. DSM 9736]|uniref:CV_2116 domain-containing protein n=1 Tax=Geobacter sp. DSM 9736 TaxID=1277350 RepID=UPI000B4FE591|nr:hypothetical protein [Geobacter sp. DSM 9736]SNB46407.1 hypothetical protein SAMN06269301_1862 [Geobacter sp. DSM 9736]